MKTLRNQFFSAHQKLLYQALGILCVGLGIVGYMVPILPGTVFILAAAYLFARSSPSLDAWLRNHRTYGPIISNWEEHHAIPFRAKVIALSSMIVSAIAVFSSSSSMICVTVTATILILSAVYVISRPPS